jgi:hypothetical protein
MASASRSIAKPRLIDVLVVHDGDLFKDIWSKKTGSLLSWGWRILNDSEATYTGGKFVPDQDLSDELLETMRQNPNVQHGDFVHYDERAFKLWPQ